MNLGFILSYPIFEEIVLRLTQRDLEWIISNNQYISKYYTQKFIDDRIKIMFPNVEDYEVVNIIKWLQTTDKYRIDVIPFGDLNQNTVYQVKMEPLPKYIIHFMNQIPHLIAVQRKSKISTQFTPFELYIARKLHMTIN